MESQECAREMREVIVHRGGRFMASPQLATHERRLGVPPRSLYFRGRSAVLGDPPAGVVADLFGIFPGWLVDLALGATAAVPAGEAVDEFAGACADWAEEHLGAVDDRDRLADHLYAVADAADASALPLFSGWRATTRPDGDTARLGHAMLVVRELRGGLHFAALRAAGMGVVDAVLADPEVGPDRLRQTGWRPQDVDDAVARRADDPDRAATRRAEAEERTDAAFGACLDVLGADGRAELAAGLAHAA
ncbi:SCO6745 family protein [Actinomycetospora aeridis]|uniref:Uncharacterized protein n=1 Tax=Actinomycetospora aeridis TaxID=3129231 RepID=A0ABU8N9B1_9PSEU